MEYTIESMLESIKKDRPDQKINKIIEFSKNEYGFYDVKVEMESNFFGIKIMKTKVTLPYPLKEYEKLSGKEKLKWRTT